MRMLGEVTILHELAEHQVRPQLEVDVRQHRGRDAGIGHDHQQNVDRLFIDSAALPTLFAKQLDRGFQLEELLIDKVSSVSVR
jgi:hypothetical protein